MLVTRGLTHGSQQFVTNENWKHVFWVHSTVWFAQHRLFWSAIEEKRISEWECIGWESQVNRHSADNYAFDTGVWWLYCIILHKSLYKSRAIGITVEDENDKPQTVNKKKPHLEIITNTNSSILLSMSSMSHRNPWFLRGIDTNRLRQPQQEILPQTFGQTI